MRKTVKFLTIQMKHNFIIALFLVQCLGIDGPSVVRGDDLVDRIRNAIRNKVALCRTNGFTNMTIPDLGYTLTYNQRVFYSTKDLDTCLSIIDAVSCEVLNTSVTGRLTTSQFIVPIFCNSIKPNSLAEKPYLEGTLFEVPKL